MGTQQLGRFVAFAPDVGKSLKAAARIFDLQDRQPPIDATSSKGDKPAQVRDIILNIWVTFFCKNLAFFDIYPKIIASLSDKRS